MFFPSTAARRRVELRERFRAQGKKKSLGGSRRFPRRKVPEKWRKIVCFSHPRSVEFSGDFVREKRLADAYSLLVKADGFPEVSARKISAKFYYVFPIHGR
jgi:hypothetical protein